MLPPLPPEEEAAAAACQELASRATSFALSRLRMSSREGAAARKRAARGQGAGSMECVTCAFTAMEEALMVSVEAPGPLVVVLLLVLLLLLLAVGPPLRGLPLPLPLPPHMRARSSPPCAAAAAASSLVGSSISGCTRGWFPPPLTM